MRKFIAGNATAATSQLAQRRGRESTASAAAATSHIPSLG